MRENTLSLKIAGIEEELKIIKSEIEKIIKIKKTSKKKPTSFSQLYGIWKGKVNFSYSDIKNAEIKVPK